jgi:hypothetical protein
VNPLLTIGPQYVTRKNVLTFSPSALWQPLLPPAGGRWALTLLVTVAAFETAYVTPGQPLGTGSEGYVCGAGVTTPVSVSFTLTPSQVTTDWWILYDGASIVTVTTIEEIYNR